MIQVRRATQQEQRLVLRESLAPADASPADVERHVDGFALYAEQMKLDLSVQWVAQDGAHWVSACTYIESPGHAALIFLPGDFDAPRRSAGTQALLPVVLRHAESRRIRLLQCLIEPRQTEIQLLAAAGLRKLARLNYMERPADMPPAPDPRPPNAGPLSWRTYEPATHPLFAQTILASYVDSLDCPGLNGLREIDDILAGHRAAAIYEPDHWFLLCRAGAPVGCLLLGELPLRAAMEIIYMGIVPAARGAGLGRVLLARAIETVRQSDCKVLTLAVDERNVPARALYERGGFNPTLSRDAWIAVGAAFSKG